MSKHETKVLCARHHIHMPVELPDWRSTLKENSVEAFAVAITGLFIMFGKLGKLISIGPSPWSAGINWLVVLCPSAGGTILELWARVSVRKP